MYVCLMSCYWANYVYEPNVQHIRMSLVLRLQVRRDTHTVNVVHKIYIVVAPNMIMGFRSCFIYVITCEYRVSYANSRFHG